MLNLRQCSVILPLFVPVCSPCLLLGWAIALMINYHLREAGGIWGLRGLKRKRSLPLCSGRFLLIMWNVDSFGNWVFLTFCFISVESFRVRSTLMPLLCFYHRIFLLLNHEEFCCFFLLHCWYHWSFLNFFFPIYSWFAVLIHDLLY